MYLNLGLMRGFGGGAGQTPGILFVERSGDILGYSEGVYGQADPIRLRGFDYDMVRFTVDTLSDLVVIELDGTNYQPAIPTITVVFVGGETVVAEWDIPSSQYRGTSAEVTALFTAQEDDWVDGVYNHPTVSPLITTQPESVVVAYPTENVATFSVVATDTSPSGIVSYQWALNGVAIAGETSANLSVPVGLNHPLEGYTVTVSNDGRSTTSDTATLTVIADNLYENHEWLGGIGHVDGGPGGTPPDAHTVNTIGGAWVELNYLDVGGAGEFFNMELNPNNVLGRTFLTYDLEDNNPDLAVGATYRISWDGQFFGRDGGNNTCLTAQNYVGMDIIDSSIAVPSSPTSQLKFVEFIVTDTTYRADFRIGCGTTSGASHTMIFSNPKLELVLDATRRLLTDDGEVLTDDMGKS